jgi:hypothetical protein
LQIVQSARLRLSELALAHALDLLDLVLCDVV